MKTWPLAKFDEDYSALSLAIKKKTNKQLEFLVNNFRHPSLRCKKYDEDSDIWQARIDRDWRFYFKIEKDFYVLLTIIKHPK